MYYYLVEKTGDGTTDNSFRPKVPVNVSYVCLDIGDQFLVGTNTVLSEMSVTDLKLFCEERTLIYEDILKWFIVGD
jgi:hypothetical protein